MSTLKQNKLTPVLGVVAVTVVIYILYRAFAGGGDQSVKAGPAMTAIPTPPSSGKDARKHGQSRLPRTTPMADVDNPSETLMSVVASSKELQATAAQLIEENRELRRSKEQASKAQTDHERPGTAPEFVYGPPGSGTVSSQSHTAPPAGQPPGGVSLGETSQAEGGAAGANADQVDGTGPDGKQKKARRGNAFEQALDIASGAAETVVASIEGIDEPKPESRRATSTAGAGSTSNPRDGGKAKPGSRSGTGVDVDIDDRVGAGHFSYRAQPPMGYTSVEDKKAGSKGATQVRYVRTLSTPGEQLQLGGTSGAASDTANQAARNAQKLEASRYFTIPENATMVGARIMTTIIGRVPVDGRVTDPLPFKALIGRDNLAANGLDLPPDVVGTIISGVAIGDMALSCSEARVRSLTFVFNDGTIRTVSAKGRSGSSGGGAGGSSGDLGYLSDEHGNPCLPGEFVTNAPRYLADVVGFGALNAYGQSLAEAQTSVTSSGLGTTSTVVDPNKYALGRAAGSATGEVTAWIMSRLKNSFDAVVTPVPSDPLKTFVVNFEQEVALDKPDDARRLVHRQQQTGPQRGARYGLE